MANTPPELVAINHDDYHAEHVGKTADGRQFFLTNPFVPATKGNSGCEFVALYLFDDHGRFLEARIDNLGPRAQLDKQRATKLFDQRLGEIGPVSFGRIEVQPFRIEQYGVSFGLVLREPEEEGDVWAVEAQPGNYMAFFEPFDSGDYDT